MEARKIHFNNITEAESAIESIGASNTQIMAGRAIHINVMLKNVPGIQARLIKSIYNEIGAEAAISQSAYYEEPGAVTDMIIMGSIYQHREAKRILSDRDDIKSFVASIQSIIDGSSEAS